MSMDHLCDKLVGIESIANIKKIRADSQKNHKLRLVDYLRHWTIYREASRARVLSAHGKPCDLVEGDLCYHLVDNPKTKLSSRVLGPYTVQQFEPGKSTAVIMGFNGGTTRAWVSNLVKVPKNDIFNSAETSRDMMVDADEHVSADAGASPSTLTNPAPSKPVIDDSNAVPSKPVIDDTNSKSAGNGNGEKAQRYLDRLPYQWDLRDLPPLVVLPPPGRSGTTAG
ncbi:hypothetical protein FOZ62_006683 [Perkinsus olseni]|uniref:Uncharacterized protein n=1 Tax=Perkinsus olseni TaxID=32597 RepID=A0A7J6N1J7_PEROL|nr:hypothetical protein FOZ62_006683 [Perkinsus olseni]